MSDGVSRLKDKFNLLAKESQTLAFLPRGIELQRSMCEEIQSFLSDLGEKKSGLVKEQDETNANVVLGMELSIGAVLAELRMWIAFKEDEPERAWEALISAQRNAEAALQVRRTLEEDEGAIRGLQNYYAHLLAIESVVFPPQIYQSVGGVIVRRTCCICNQDYDACPHIKGHAYMGKLCHTVIDDFEVQEVSIVDQPANKLCRITHFSAEAGMRNRMTWRIEERTS